MPKIQIMGRVIPEYVDLTAPKVLVDWQHQGTGIKAKIHVKIEQSKVVIDATTNKFETPDERNFLIRHAYDLAHTIIDIFVFQCGGGLDLTFDTITVDDGKTTQLRGPDPKLAAISKAAKSIQDVGALIGLAHNNLTIAMALRHLNEALTAPRRTSVRSAQCVDGIRSLFVPPGKKKEAGWQPMNEALQLTKSYLDPVMKESRSPRHGDYQPLAEINRSDSVFRAWEVMNRFLEYKKRGDKQLPLAEFPLLT
jgi:hypothetical protein